MSEASEEEEGNAYMSRQRAITRLICALNTEKSI